MFAEAGSSGTAELLNQRRPRSESGWERYQGALVTAFYTLLIVGALCSIVMIGLMIYLALIVKSASDKVHQLEGIAQKLNPVLNDLEEIANELSPLLAFLHCLEDPTDPSCHWLASD